MAIADLSAKWEHRSVKGQRSHQLSQYAEMKSMYRLDTIDHRVPTCAHSPRVKADIV